jgi:hypothetical protein
MSLFTAGRIVPFIWRAPQKLAVAMSTILLNFYGARLI